MDPMRELDRIVESVRANDVDREYAPAPRRTMSNYDRALEVDAQTFADDIECFVIPEKDVDRAVMLCHLRSCLLALDDTGGRQPSEAKFLVYAGDTVRLMLKLLNAETLRRYDEDEL